MSHAFSRVPSSFLLGSSRGSTAGTVALDVAYVHYTSGNCWGLRFVSPVTQTNGALSVYAYCTAVTGTPSDVRCAVYNGPTGTNDIDRPENAAALATSGAVDCSSSDGHWVEFALTGVSLTRSQTYYVLVDNRTGTPGSHYPTFQTRSLIQWGLGDSSALTHKPFQSISATNGFSADGASELGACGCVEFDDGSVMGLVFAGNESHASNANARGVCFTPTEDLLVSGIIFAGTNAAWTGGTVDITVQSGGASVASASIDRAGGQTSPGPCGRFAPTRLTGGVAYNITATPSGNTTTAGWYTMGEASPPDAVAACVPPGWGAVDGTTVDHTRTINMLLIVDENPAIDTPAVASVLDSDTVRGAAGTIATRTLSAANETVAAGYYAATTLSAVDADLAVGNIVSGKTIFGFAGEAVGGGGGRPEIRGSNL